VDEVYALAAETGGVGFITPHDAQVVSNNTQIDLNTLDAARVNGVKRCLYTSSASVYPFYRQTDSEVAPIQEEDAYPAVPPDANGWAKLLTERLYMHYNEDYGLETRIVRLHNVFRPSCPWDGGREQVVAALCRKIAVAKLTGKSEVEIWGDGEQTRSFCYIEDCVEGIYRAMRSDYPHPLNLGSDRLITINELADVIAAVAGVGIAKRHVAGPQGVRGRNSDNTRIRSILGWEGQSLHEQGIFTTYSWIEEQVKERYSAKSRRSVSSDELRRLMSASRDVPKGRSVVEIWARRLKTPIIDRFPVHHLFVVLDGNNGKRWAYSGDLQWSGSSLARLIAYSEPFRAGARDWPTRAGLANFARWTLAEGLDGDYIKKCFDEEAARITNMRYRYDPRTFNCNAVVRHLLRAAGLPRLQPSAIAPGFDHDAV
jgi:GDP-D-mannose 3',5'-epimerase